MRSLVIMSLAVVLTGCSFNAKSAIDLGEQAIAGGTGALTDVANTLPLPDGLKSVEEEVELSDEEKGYLSELGGYISVTEGLENYTAHTTINSVLTMSSENYQCERNINITSLHRTHGGLPQVKQITDEFNYVGKELVYSTSWASYRSGNIVGAEYIGNTMKWEDNGNTADIKYGVSAESLIDLTEATVQGVQKIVNGGNISYKVHLREDGLTIKGGIIGLDNHPQDMPADVSLCIVIDKSLGVVKEATLSLTTTSKNMMRTPNGRLHYYDTNNPEYKGLSKVSVMCEERTHTVYTDIGSTDFGLPNLASYPIGTRDKFINMLRKY